MLSYGQTKGQVPPCVLRKYVEIPMKNHRFFAVVAVAILSFTGSHAVPLLIAPTQPGKEEVQALYTLILGATLVTDTGLKELANLKILSSLILFRTQVTDTGLKELANLKSLVSLDLGATQVTDARLKELAKLQNHSALNLDDTLVNYLRPKELANLHNVSSLNHHDRGPVRCRKITRRARKWPWCWN
jgi:hypothetical protein